MYNLLLGAAAGDGVETTSALFEKILRRKGLYLFSMRDFMSRVRGGHNFVQLRFGAKPVVAHRYMIDGLVAFNEETFELHKKKLSSQGFILCDNALKVEGGQVIKMDLNGLAKQSGNIKAVGTVCLGALLKLFGLGLEHVEEILTKQLAKAILQANIEAVKLGYSAAPKRFSLEAGDAQNTLLLTGAQAMGLGAIAGGMNFYSAYPMSPSTTLLDFFNAHHEEMRIGVEQAEDEIAAVNMALGASYAGARAMVGTSGGGFSLMVEAMGFAGVAEIPIVMVDVQRPGPATGLPTRTEQSDLQFVVSASQGEFPRMVIAVKNAQDAFYQTARAQRIAQQYQMPVVLLSDQYIADSATTITPFDVALAQKESTLPVAEKCDETYMRYKITDSGISPLAVPTKSKAIVKVDSDEHTEQGVITEAADVRVAMVDKRTRKLEGLLDELIEPSYVGAKNPELLLVGFGSTTNAIAEAVEILNAQEGLAVGALAFSDVFPLPLKMLEKYVAMAEKVVNIEQNATGQLACLMRQEAMINCTDSLLKYDGRQLSADDIISGIAKMHEGEK